MCHTQPHARTTRLIVLAGTGRWQCLSLSLSPPTHTPHRSMLCREVMVLLRRRCIAVPPCSLAHPVRNDTQDGGVLCGVDRLAGPTCWSSPPSLPGTLLWCFMCATAHSHTLMCAVFSTQACTPRARCGAHLPVLAWGVPWRGRMEACVALSRLCHGAISMFYNCKQCWTHNRGMHPTSADCLKLNHKLPTN